MYSLGVLLCDLVITKNVGDARRALEALIAALTRDGAQAGRMQRQDVPPAAWEVIARALRRDPSTRWDDVASMRKALATAWAAAPAPPSPSPVLAPAMPQPRPATLAMPSAGSPLRAPTAAMPPAPKPIAAPFTGPMPPVPPAMPAQPAFTAPPFSGPAFTAPPAPAAPSAWEAPPPPVPAASSADAWATLKPAGHAQARAALASSWDAAAPSPPGPPPSTLASSWDAGDANPNWVGPPSYAPMPPSAPMPAPPRSAPQVPIASAPSADDDDWEDETCASAEHPLRAVAPHAIAPSAPAKALQNKLAEMVRQESTMALDIDSLNLGAMAPSPPRAASEDWKEGVVLLDTAPARDLEESDEEPYEPGSRTHVTPTPAPVLDTMETLRPMQRPVGIEPFVPRPVGMSGPIDSESTFVASSPLVPEAPARPLTVAPFTSQPVTTPLVALPPVSERTMALDLSVGPDSVVQTVPAPMGLRAQPPIAPQRPAAPAPAAPSKTPIIIAVVIAMLLIAAAIIVVITRK